MLHYDLKNISKVKISGHWKVLITNNDREELIVECTEQDKKYIRHTINENALELELGKRLGLFSFKPDNAINAKISIEKLQALELCGDSNVFFQGFEGEQLSIKCTGAFDLQGTNSSYTHLFLQKTGCGRVNLKNSQVVNANVLSMGIGDLLLNMNGGQLSGKIMGMGNTILSGVISTNSLVNMGLSSVHYGITP